MSGGWDTQQIEAARKWPMHEVHGDPGFVTMRHSLLMCALDELTRLRAELDEATYPALRAVVRAAIKARALYHEATAQFGDTITADEYRRCEMAVEELDAAILALTPEQREEAMR